MMERLSNSEKKTWPLYTLILLHYRQEMFYKEALSSIFTQTYPNIELIFVDDGTLNINEQEIRAYIDQNKQSNITEVSFLFNKQNQGTVYTLKNAIAMAHGSYLQFFAADDKLASPEVVEKCVDAFEKMPGDQKVLATQTDMMDFGLKERTWFRPLPEQKVRLANLTDPHQLFEMTCVNCVFGISSMIFRPSLFSEYPYLDESMNTVIEDWPLILRLSRRGEIITYRDFTTILHRDGGISNKLTRGISPLQLVFAEEHLKVIEQDILPYLNQLPMREQVMVYDFYQNALREHNTKYGKRKGISKNTFIRKNFSLSLRIFKNWLISQHWFIWRDAKTAMKSCFWFALVALLGTHLFSRLWLPIHALLILSFIGFGGALTLYILMELVMIRIRMQ